MPPCKLVASPIDETVTSIRDPGFSAGPDRFLPGWQHSLYPKFLKNLPIGKNGPVCQFLPTAVRSTLQPDHPQHDFDFAFSNTTGSRNLGRRDSSLGHGDNLIAQIEIHGRVSHRQSEGRLWRSQLRKLFLRGPYKTLMG